MILACDGWWGLQIVCSLAAVALNAYAYLENMCVCHAFATTCCSNTSLVLLLGRLLAIKILGKLPLDSARPALLLGERIHHSHVLLVAPGWFVVVVVEVVLLVVRPTASAVAVRSAAAVKFVVCGEFVGRVVGAVVVLGWEVC